MSKGNTKARFTRYTSESLLTKRLTLVPDTSIELYGPPQEIFCLPLSEGQFTHYPAVHPQYLKKIAAVMGRGQFVTDEVSTLDEFIDKVEAMTSNECTGYGTALADSGEICVDSKDGENGAISRTLKYFEFRKSGGVFMIDIDTGNLTPQEAYAAIVKAMPELAKVRMGCRASSGSNIYGSLTGHLIKGPGGWHFYFLIDDATKIPELGELLVKRLWLTGQGHILITANGRQLVRSLADPCIWQANRPDFVADAVCCGMLEKKSVAPVLFGSEQMLSVPSLVPLSADEEQEYQRLIRDEKRRTTPEAAQVKEVWFEDNATLMLPENHTPVDKVAAIRKLKEMDVGGVLPLNFVLYTDRNQTATVREILMAPDKYDGSLICDPVEPDYGGWSKNTRLNVTLTGLKLCSWSHGIPTDYTSEERTQQEACQYLATLSPLEFEKDRRAYAAQLGVTVKTLVAEVGKARKGEAAGATQADELIALVESSGATLFRDGADVEAGSYARIAVDSHFEVYQCGSKAFSHWLLKLYWDNTNRTIRSPALKEAIDTLTGLALMTGKTQAIHRRVAKHDDKYYIDIGDPEWHVIELDESGWSVIQDPPVRFQRSGSSQALPMPVPGTGDTDLLWDVVNVEKDQRKFVLTWMIDALRPDTPYPVCELSGQQGTAKSGSHRAIRALIDPNKVPLRSEPKGREDVQVQAGISHMVSYENLSRLAKPVQDLLSVIATGGGTGQRTLYTTNDETVIKLKNPILLNGIHPVITMADLADRAINLTLPPIPKNARLLESDVVAKFESSKIVIFTGLLDAYAGTLAELPNVVIKDPPRMIEFSYLGEALCRYFGWKQTFDTEYQQMRTRLLLESAQGSPVIVAISEMTTAAKQPNAFKGTLKQLLERLDDYKPDSYKGWPKSPRGLSEMIARHTPGLAEMGVKIEHLGHSRAGNKIRISKM